MYDTILVPTDGSEHAVRAAEHALSLAEVFDATVHVLNVVDVQAAAGPFDSGGVGEEFVGELDAAGRSAIDEIEAVADDRVPLVTAVLEGEPRDAILEYAADNDVELVVMGTHGRTGVGRYVAGSVCEHVIRHADVPVITVQATESNRSTGEYDDILLPTDGSEAAAAAIEHGIAIADVVGARIHAVNVVDLGDVAASAEYTIPNDLIEALEEDGKRATGEIASRAEEAGVPVVTSVTDGFPARDLLEYAADEDVDLIVMGTAGRTGLNRFLMGSTTERIVRHADVPVFSVNARGIDEE